MAQPRTVLDITLGGRSLSAAVAATVSLVLVRHALGVPAAAEIDFTQPDKNDFAAIRHDDDLVLRVGANPIPLFSGRIVAIEHNYDGANGRMARIRAFDLLYLAHRTCRLLALENASAKTIAKQIAEGVGLTLPQAFPDLPTRSLVVQHGESDLALLRRLAAEARLYPAVRDRTLHLFSLAGEGNDIPLRLGHELHSVHVRRSRETELPQIDVVGWDAATLATYRRTLGARDTSVAASVGAHEGGRFALDRLVHNDGQLADIGQGMLDRAAAAAVTASGVCAGDPAVMPGAPVALTGLAGAPVALTGLAGDVGGRFVVTEAIHRIDAKSEYTTAFSTSPPPDLRPSAVPIITYGRVSSTNDKEELGRCQVCLETFGGVQSGWLQVLVPGAGSGKGLTALPEVDDEVLIVLPDADPTRGFVLGGLYGRRRLPRGAAVHKTRPFVLRTADGQTLQLGGDPSIARLSTSNGSLVELTQDRMRVAAATDLVIEAPGRTMTIRAKTINFEQG
ncbi:phage baseplate assembly protein V [Bradyrhizobium sp. SZCCHNS3051]|uniref:phage baseplate assembly protein V n=1 Tax=Bradyrhizobium sp. SZCCHNS3051 TaxID=3057320 RepID=UPI0029165F4A|nr:phage baseplate assembly protein V [Bradyrhizobium sp. SZCCHNS3051]